MVAGAMLEEISIKKISELLNNMSNNETAVVLKNLLKCSKNNLKVLIREIRLRGITYLPQYLRQDEIEFT